LWVVALVDDVRVRRAADARDDNVVVCVLFGDIDRAEHERCATVRDGTEVVQPKRVCDNRALHRRLNVNLLLELCLRIVDAVLWFLIATFARLSRGASYLSRYSRAVIPAKEGE